MAIEEDVKSPQEYLDLMIRRKWRIVLPAIVIAGIAIAVALLVPPVYRSTAMVLIEEPEVPREFIRSTITSFAAERLQVIEKRVMTTQNLISVINKFDLYRDERRTTPIGDLAQVFRTNISLELVSADVVDPRSGRPTQATIAFNVSFEDRDPRVAQQVANELVTLYLNENLRDRRQRAAQTTDFLAEESRRFGLQVSELEEKLAVFKQENAGHLPGQLDVNMRLIERTEGEIASIENRLQALKERRIFLDAELAQLSPYGTRVVDGQTVLNPNDRLKALQTQYISIQGVYGENHPDVARMRREIDILKKETGAGTDANALKTQLSEVMDELEITRKRYGDKHPDVVTLQRQAANLREAIKTAGREGPRSNPMAAPPDNPPYLMVQAQINALEIEASSLNRQRDALKETLKQYEARVMKTPEVERQHQMLMRNYQNAHQKYQEIRSKQLEAQLAQSLETERKGERFSLIEPPQMPREPVRPNRLAIMFIGLVFAGAVGVGNAFLAESIDQGVYGPRQLTRVVGAPPLIVIPLMEEPSAGTHRRWWIALAVVGVLSVIGVVLAVMHYFVTPLDVFWFSTLRRFGISG